MRTEARFAEAEALFPGRFFPREEFGTNVRQVYLEVKLRQAFALAREGRRADAAALAATLGQPVPGFDFTGDPLKKLDWNDRVTDILPEFSLYDPYVTREFTVADLLTHRSGLGLGAGDLMIWPGRNDFRLDDIIHNLRYLKPVSRY